MVGKLAGGDEGLGTGDGVAVITWTWLGDDGVGTRDGELGTGVWGVAVMTRATAVVSPSPPVNPPVAPPANCPSCCAKNSPSQTVATTLATMSKATQGLLAREEFSWRMMGEEERKRVSDWLTS